MKDILLDILERAADKVMDLYDLLMTYWYLVLVGMAVFLIILLMLVFNLRVPFL